MLTLAFVVYDFFDKLPRGIGQLLEVLFHNLDNLAISGYDRFSFLSYSKHTLKATFLTNQYVDLQ